jgi:uncharacterized protein (DUF433 family)
MDQQPFDAPISNAVVTGTIRWPTIKNTRLTLFDLMDQLRQGLPPEFVANWYHLSAAEMDEAMRFLAEHTAELEQAYAEANADAEEQRRYWTERNRPLLERDISQFPPPPGSDPRLFAAWEKLVALKRANARSQNGANENPC